MVEYSENSVACSITHGLYLFLKEDVFAHYTRTPLHVSLMLSFGGGFASVAAVPGVQIALDLINANPHLLPGYTLHYSLSDSQVYCL